MVNETGQAGDIVTPAMTEEGIRVMRLLYGKVPDAFLADQVWRAMRREWERPAATDSAVYGSGIMADSGGVSPLG
jgi:hypothetical protein